MKTLILQNVSQLLYRNKIKLSNQFFLPSHKIMWYPCLQCVKNMVSEIEKNYESYNQNTVKMSKDETDVDLNGALVTPICVLKATS